MEKKQRIENLIEEWQQFQKKPVVAQSSDRWVMVFNELCEDGVIRPVSILPQQVSCIKHLDTPIDGGKYGASVELSECTLIVHGGREIILFEIISEVLIALGSALAAKGRCEVNMFYSGNEFKKQNLNYAPEFERPV